MKKYWRTIGIGISLENCADIEINYGQNKFVFSF